ncbi:MAG: dihydropteroate synthase [Candidatus Anammoxibacter sp.]
MCKEYTITHNKGQLQFGRKTRIVGVINLTPDSFSKDGFCYDTEKALQHADDLVREGADIIDVGGESTRPEASPVSEEEELRRVIPLIKELSKSIDVPISIDTYKSRVAEKALDAGAQIINDISGLRADKDMVNVVVASKAPIILMHMQGTPLDMQNMPTYNDVVSEIILFFQELINKAISHGVDEHNIIIDPGIGFGKTVRHNLEILNRLEEFKELGCPIMVGPSRKAFIGKVLNKPEEERLLGTLATVAIAIAHGSNIIRVHDVNETVEIAKMCDAIINSNQKPVVDDQLSITD